jgi:hypothetical protein
LTNMTLLQMVPDQRNDFRYRRETVVPGGSSVDMCPSAVKYHFQILPFVIFAMV